MEMMSSDFKRAYRLVLKHKMPIVTQSNWKLDNNTFVINGGKVVMVRRY